MIVKGEKMATDSNLGGWTLIVLTRLEILYGTGQRSRSPNMSANELNHWLLEMRLLNGRNDNKNIVNISLNMIIAMIVVIIIINGNVITLIFSYLHQVLLDELRNGEN